MFILSFLHPFLFLPLFIAVCLCMFMSLSERKPGKPCRLDFVFDTAPYRQMIFRTFFKSWQKRKTAPFLIDKQNQKVWIKVVKTK